MENRNNKTFLLFSCILFIIIFIIASVAYTFSARQINRSHIEQQLAIASETIKLRLLSVINSELALVLKLGDTPVIREYFLNPGNPGLEAQANAEFDLFLKHIKGSAVFWVSDKDKIFHMTNSNSYVIDPNDPETYWYNMTLYRTKVYNFNINYNPDIQQIYLWVNVPVFDNSTDIKNQLAYLA
uniref:Uncharacterized protein n=1 Tax=uncultured bacterium contig00049 TaxID=1181534 RepID=A0A806KKL2_9BACT|nr:hypothetical protein [uncultured bacterium contig00049]